MNVIKQLLLHITSAIAVLADFKTTIADQQAALKVKDTTIAYLHVQLDAGEFDDAALRTAVTDAQGATAALQTQIDELTPASNALAAALTAQPETPSVDGNFNVTAPGDPV